MTLIIITIVQMKFGGEVVSSISLRFSCFFDEANGLSLIKRRVEFVLTIAARART